MFAQKISLKFLLLSVLLIAPLAWHSEASAAQLQLSWTDNSDNEDGSRIERRTGTSGTFALIAFVGPNITSYTDVGLADGTTYCYRVNAFNTAGASDYSNESCSAPTSANFALTVSNVSALSNAGTGSGTVTSSPAGINCGASCSASVTSGASVTLTPTPASGSVFSGWSGACSGTANCTLTMDAAKSATATFSKANRSPVANAGPDQTVTEGASVTLSATASSDPDGDTLTFSWTQTAGPSATLSGATTVTPTLTAPLVGLTGALLTFQLTVTDTGSLSSTDTVNVQVTSEGIVKSKVTNLSTRSSSGTGDNIVIGGFIIDGTTPKTVLIRARGPALGDPPFLLPGILPNPFLRLFSGQTVIAENDNWRDSQEGEIVATGLDPCQPNPGQTSAPTDCDLESAVLITLDPGPYTAHVSGVNGGTGVGLSEILDLSEGSGLYNVSARSVAGIGDNIIIAGFIIEGETPRTILVRGIGPTLANFGVPRVLVDPVLNLFSGQQVIASNDNWQSNQEAAIIETGLSPTDSRESAILVTLDPGVYTAHLSGVVGETGVGLVEIFRLD